MKDHAHFVHRAPALCPLCNGNTKELLLTGRAVSLQSVAMCTLCTTLYNIGSLCVTEAVSGALCTLGNGYTKGAL